MRGIRSLCVCVCVWVYLCAPHSPSDHLSKKSKIIRSPHHGRSLRTHTDTQFHSDPPSPPLHKGLIGFRSGDVREPAGCFWSCQCWDIPLLVWSLWSAVPKTEQPAWRRCIQWELHNYWMSQHGLFTLTSHSGHKGCLCSVFGTDRLRGFWSSFINKNDNDLKG